MFKCDGFILFYSDAKPKIPLQHRDQDINRLRKSDVGHAGRDVQTGGSGHFFITLPYTVAEGHIKNNTVKLKCGTNMTIFRHAFKHLP